MFGDFLPPIDPGDDKFLATLAMTRFGAAMIMNTLMVVQ
jgi:hypothetical protein